VARRQQSGDAYAVDLAHVGRSSRAAFSLALYLVTISSRCRAM
jgi:hypothetical protein